MNIKINHIIRCFFCLLFIQLFAMNPVEGYHCDSIKVLDLMSKATGFKNRMNAGNAFSESEAIQLVKVYNTFHLAELFENKKYNSITSAFIKLFEKKYMKQVLNTLTYTFGKGMMIYSSKHDLYVGLGMTYRC